jgi:CSLREA domain-containing protein
VKKPPRATLRKQLKKKTLAAIAQAIEPRLLFSADTAALAITPIPEVTANQVSSQHQQSANTNSPMQASAPSQLFVLDLRIQDAQGLLAGLMQQQSAAQSRDETFEILVLDSNDDGISKISHALARQGNISALHLMGHGDDGMMVLGSTWIDQATLRARASDFASWADGFSLGSDILIYGCDFAANEAGKESAKSLAQITGADVAASTDKTANVLNGGNWALEYQVGQLQNTSNDVISAAALWQGDLATYIVTNNADAGTGSLRQAISDANLNAGSDTVFFNILGSTFQSINLQSPLPTIIDGLFIDGATQSGWAAESLKIELNGANAGTLTNGLSISSTASVTVRGLVINNFDGHGILIEAGSGHVIAGNIIGLNASASAVLANSGTGIHIVNSANNRIGGLFPSDRNIISGNAKYGIALRSGSDGTVVSGNYIGTDFSGSVALGNLFDGVTVTDSTAVVIGGEVLGSGNLISGNIRNGIGIYASGGNHTIAGNIIGLNTTGTVALANQQSGIAVANATGNLIGGSAPGARNVISGNGESGIYLVNSSGNVVVNNLIGRDAANAANVGNRAGITLDTNTSNNQIGGINTGEGNVIAGSTWDGIIVAATSVNNALIANRYFSNSESAIDLNGDGVNQNDDAPDADTSANDLQNYPALYSAIISGTDVNILGELRSAINTSFLIQFYNNPAGSEDPTGYGEGYQLLGFATVTTDASGNASLNTTFSSMGMNAGDRVSAIATVDLGGGNFGNTSEFSQNVPSTLANTSPSIILNAIAPTYKENDPAVFIDMTASIFDSENGNFDSGSLVVETINNGSSRDVFSINTEGMGAGQVAVSGNNVFYSGVSVGTFTTNNLQLTVTFNANSSVAAAQQVLRNVTFSITGQDPNPTTRNIQVRVNDGDGGLASTNLNLPIAVDNTLYVTTNTDVNDGDTSNLFNFLANRGADGAVSLREAILAINNSGNLSGNQIHFNIASGGVQRISVASSLPSINREITIEGRTQPGYTDVPLIEIDGSLATEGDGLILAPGSSGSTIRALSIINFAGTGLGGHGILVFSNNNIIQSNHLGVTSNGASAGNFAGLVLLSGASNNWVGGTNADQENVISGNSLGGISITGLGTTNNHIIGNYIGVGADGASARANGDYGVNVWGESSGNYIGGIATGEGNLIQNNLNLGISVQASASVAILGNVFANNGAIGIDLNGNGVSNNDAGDGDLGANGLQNFPSIVSASSSPSSFTILSSLNSLPNTNYRIEYFLSQNKSASGYGEGVTLLGSQQVSTNSSGYASTNFLGATSLPVGYFVTATATVDLGGGTFGGTSEFSKSVEVSVKMPAVDVSWVGNAQTSESGAMLTYDVVLRQAPTANVTIAVSTSRPSEGAASTSSLTFTPTNWNIPQTITVTGINDTVIDGDRSYELVLGAAISLDPAYSGIVTANNTLINVDDDTSNAIIVTTTSDVADGDTSSLANLLNNQGADGKISLREAILAANNTANSSVKVDSILFNIEDALINGAHTITVASALPAINDAVIIDGSSEPDWSANANRPVLVIDGNDLSTFGLYLSSDADGSTIRGLIIQNSSGDGIFVEAGSDGNTIAGNYIGALLTSGGFAGSNKGNAFAGINILGANNTIGGASASDRNVISGNANGILVQGSLASSNRIAGNYIGTDATGNSVLRNTSDGIRIQNGANANVIGGVSSIDRNVISGNGNDGVEVSGSASNGNQILGNYIGVSANGLSNLTSTATFGSGIFVVGGASNTQIGRSGAGNVIAGFQYIGIEVDGASNGTVIQGNRIGTDASRSLNWGTGQSGIVIENGASTTLVGGTNLGDGNIVAYSGQGNGVAKDGITIAGSGSGNAILGNSFFFNLGLGIDLRGNSGVTPNDSADVDNGPNDLQNFPVLTTAVSSGGNTTVTGTLNSRPNTNYRIEFFSSSANDTSNHGEGDTYLGFINVSTDAAGNASFSPLFVAQTVPIGSFVTSTATVDLGGGQFGSTSEFSLNTAVVNLATISGTVYEDTNANGQLTDDGVAIAGAIVSLYRDNGDGVIGSGDTLEDIRNTNASGQYTFNNLTSATYWVVVDSRTFSGTSGLNLGFNLNDVWAEQTYGSSGSLTWSSGSYAYSATAGLMLGGMRAERSDNGANLLSAEHVTRVILAGTNQTAVDYGFSFNAITNTRDSDDVAANNRTVQGSLRQFIQNSNALTGVQSSEFRVATTDSNFASGVAVISLSTSLPTITDTILLDATTQTNWSGNTNAAVLGTGGDVGHNPVGLSQLQAPEVEIRDFVGDTNLLKILGNNTVIRGFSLVGGGVAGDANSSTIEVSANNVTIERNLIGSSANTVANPGVQKNAAIGIRVLGQATIDGNILAYIAMHAISVETGGSNSAIYNNEFVAPSSVFNDQAAVAIRDASNVQVNGNLVRNSGGNAVKLQANAESNIIRNNSLLNSGNLPDGNGHAIDILGSSDNNLIEGNLIEASAGAAIAISGSADNKIGGTTLAQANAIINNAGAGVLLLSSAGGNQAILGNLIYGNAGLGIDLNADGVSPNDNLPDPDVGPNDLQNFPVLNLVTTAAGNTTIAGYLNGAANTRYRIEFFSAAVAHTSGHGQAQNFLGFTNILTNAMGNANFNVSLPGVSLLANTAVSATATVNLAQGSFGSTSEFSANVSSQTTLPGITVSPISGNTSELGASATFSVVLNSAPTADVTITIASNTLLEGTASRSSLTFTSANWNVSQVVTVTGVNEDLVDGDRGYSILLGSAISSDSNYSGLDVPDVTVINLDNDVASNITVTTSDDTNDGDTSSLYALQSNKGADGFISLREAIIAANNTPNGIGGIDQILFNIADPLIAGAHTINLESALPTISTSMSINATTEPDFFSNASQPMVVLNGNGVIQNGITINALGSNSNIRGLIVQGFTDNAIYIQANSDGNTIAGNYLGQINAQGIEATALNANGGSGVRIEGSFNTIGGANLSDRNIIAGNYAGISVVSGGFNRVMGNFIGTDASGARSVANRDSGIHLEATNSNLIGGSTIAARNVISGNLKNGILLDMGANRTSIFGNYIGTDSTGLIAVGNNQLDEIFYAGVTVLDSIGTQVGGGLIDHGNVISGNFGHGVTLGNNAMGSVIAGNTIGLGSDGLTVIGNSKYGVKISTSNVLVGGTIAADRNVISGNSQGGVYITGADATENRVQGNYIGTDRNGQLDRGNTLSGVAIDLGASRNQIGGAVAGGGNVISGNNLNGVALEALARGNDVSNNFIGIGSDGVTAIGNSASGVRLSDGASNNLIGGTARIFHNKIMHNEGAGVLVSNTGVSPTGNAILGNEIALNSGLEIDLGPDGVNTNDLGDGDSGVNQLQNFPVLTSASSIAGTTTISGYINSEANSSFRLEFFSSNTADLSGHGDASTYIGFLVVTTDNSGNAYFTATLAGLSLGAGQFVSATATQFMGAVIYRSTSELASNIVVGATPPGITVSDPSLIISESGSSAQFSLVLNAAPLADVTIALSVSNPGEAILSRSLITFTVANWNVQQTVTITGLDDSVVDGTQAFSINIEPAASLYLGYSGLDATNVSVQNLDNDTFNRIIVDTTSDRADGDTSSIAALYASKGADGRISLREAVLAANNTINGSQRDEIVFNISQPLSNGLHSISLTSALPEITDAVIIDGTSEPDYAATQVIALNGLGAGNSSGLIISASDSEISGLNLSQFQIDGIKVYGNNNVISNNFISSNNGVGIYVQDATVLIKSNAISNQSKGIVINGLASLVTVSQNQADSVAFLVDLTNDGTTPNDLDDADVGPNGLLNKPVITSVNTNSMSQVQLNGAINTQANRTVSIEVYEHGQISQGARSRYVGTFSITTDASGNANFSQSFGGTFAAGTLFSATAISTTSPNSGSSSEHSDAVRARAQAPAAAAVLVTQTLLNVNESGTNASFGLVLASAPVADVVINLSTSQAGEVSLSTNVIVFTPLNWNVTQFVTATGVQDYVSDGSQTINIITSNAVSTDANYDGLDVVDVTVSNLEVPNLAPMILAPSGFTATEDTTGNLGGSITGLSINDPDAGNSVVSLTLTTSNGSFSLISIAGLTFTVGNGSASNLMTFQGSVAAINNAINVISFTPDAQYFGNANFSITVDDLGNSGIGGALSASRFVPILVSSVNDGATLTGSARAVVIEGGTVVIQPSMLSLVDIDTDVSDLVFTVMASTGDGEFMRSGVSLRIGDSFSQADIDAQLIQFSHFGGERPTANVTLSASERFGNPVADFDMIFSIIAVNDPPIINSITLAPVLENSPVGTAVASVSAMDVDSLAPLSFSLVNDAQGTFKIDPITGLISVKETTNIDFETNSQIVIRIRASDSSGAFVERDLTVLISDIAESTTTTTVIPIVGVSNNGGGGGNSNSNSNGGPTNSLPSIDSNLPARPQTGTNTQTTPSINTSGTAGSVGLNNSSPDVESKLQTRVSEVPRSSQTKAIINREKESFIDPSLNTPNAIGGKGNDKAKLVLNQLLEQQDADEQTKRRRELNGDSLDYLLFKSRKSPTTLIPANVRLSDFKLPANAQSTSIPEDSIDATQTSKNLSVVIDTIEVGGMALSVGAVAWATRAGGLLAALLSAIPAWKGLDPLLVLSPSKPAKSLEFEEFSDTEIRLDEEAVREVL